MPLHRAVVALAAITSAQPGGGEPAAAAAYNRGSEPPHAWSTKPWAPPKSVPLDHVAETYSGMDHEVLAANAQARDDEDRAAAAAEAALEAAADKSPEAFLKAVRTFKPGDYDLLLRDRIIGEDFDGLHPGDELGTLHIVQGQNARIKGHVRLPWNGRFQVKGSSAVLGLTLLTLRRQRGEAHGVVHNRGGQVTLDRVEFFDNEVSGDGAAVSTSGGTAVTTIDHCDFHQNVAAGAGGAIAVRGAGAVVHITAAHFLSNRGGRGGAVAVLDGAAARVTDCKFHRNSADRFGGGVFVAEDAQATRIVRAELVQNSAAAPIGAAVDLSLVDRGDGIFWKGEGRYDRAWGNTLELSVDAHSKVEGVVASSFIRATAAPAESAPPPKLPPAGDVPLELAADKEL